MGYVAPGEKKGDIIKMFIREIRLPVLYIEPFRLIFGLLTFLRTVRNIRKLDYHKILSKCYYRFYQL